MKKMIPVIMLAMIFCLPAIAQPVEYFIPDKSDVMEMNDSISELVKITPNVELKEFQKLTKGLEALNKKLVKSDKPIDVTKEITQLVSIRKNIDALIKKNPDVVKGNDSLLPYLIHYDQMMEWLYEANQWAREQRGQE